MDDETIINLADRMKGPAPSHRRFVGAPIDFGQIDALALGDLWAAAHAMDLRAGHGPDKSLAASTACAVLDLARRMEPVFRGQACLEYLDLLTREAEAGEGSDNRWGSRLRNACFALSRCIDLSFDGIGAAADEKLLETICYTAIEIARLTGSSTEG